MNIEPTSKLFWILQNVAPAGWECPYNFCALFRQLLGLVIIGLLAVAVSITELFAMAFTVIELLFRNGITIIIEGEEVYQTWTELYLGVEAGPAAFILIFGSLGWIFGIIISCAYAFEYIAYTDWYCNVRENYLTRRAARQAAKEPKIPSEAWILFTTWIESVHEKTCPTITYNERAPQEPTE